MFALWTSIVLPDRPHGGPPDFPQGRWDGEIWPAFKHVDTSFAALGGAVNSAQSELLLVVIEAPADRKTRDKWLDRLWQAIQDEGIDYPWMVQDRWGELCGSRETASSWADEFLGPLRTAWSDPLPGNYVLGTSPLSWQFWLFGAYLAHPPLESSMRRVVVLHAWKAASDFGSGDRARTHMDEIHEGSDGGKIVRKLKVR